MAHSAEPLFKNRRVESHEMETMAQSAGPLLKKRRVESHEIEMEMIGSGNARGINVTNTNTPVSSRILDLVRSEDETHVDALKDQIKTANSADVNFYYEKDKKTALHHAAQKGECDVVKILLVAGADIKYKDSAGSNALHLAVKSESRNAADIFKLLLPQRKKLKGMKACDVDSSKCICRRQSKSGADCWIENATSTDEEGFTVLDLALKKLTKEKTLSNEALTEIITYIIRETDTGCFLRLMRNKRKEDGEFTTPMRKLIGKMPEIVKEVFDRCIEHRSGKIAFHYELLDDVYFLNTWPPKPRDYCDKFNHYDWEFLSCKDVHTQRNCFQRLRNVYRYEMKDIENYKPYTRNAETLKNNHPFMLMIKNQWNDSHGEGIFQELLDHPLVKALVKRQWSHIGLKFHVMNLILYLIFLGLITASVVTSVPPYMKESNTTCNGTGTCNASSTICQNGTTCQNSTSTLPRKSFEGDDVAYRFGVFVLASVMLLNRVFPIVKMVTWTDFYVQYWTYVEIEVFMSSMIYASMLVNDEANHIQTIVWLFGTFSVFFAWVNLLSYLKMFENMGIYVGIFERIVGTFVKKILFLVAILLMAFTVVFNSIRRTKEEFSTLGHSLVMTASMTITGFDYEADDFFEDLDGHYDIINVAYFFYCLFLLVMTIIIINLMVGVSVYNVHEMHRQAQVSNSISQIEYVLVFEGVLRRIINKWEHFRCIRTLKKWFVLNPTEEIWRRHLKSTSSGFQPDTVQVIRKLIGDDDVSKTEATEKKNMKGLRSQIDAEFKTVKEEIENLREDVKSMTETLKIIERLMNK